MSDFKKQIQQVQESYNRCCKDEAFFKDFYRRFLSQSDEIAFMFKETDWNRQLHLIKSALKSAILYAKEPSVMVVRMHMERIADLHSRKRLNVRPELYAIWLNSMVETIREHDPKYSATLEKAWERALTPAIRLFMSRYKDVEDGCDIDADEESTHRRNN